MTDSKRVPIKAIKEFLGPQVVTLFLWGTAAGLVLFVTEVIFAYGLQAFLLVLGVANATVVEIPNWIPQTNLKTVLFFIFAVALVRGALQSIQIFLQGRAPEQFKYLQRSRLLNWSFHGKSVSTSAVNTLFTERCNLAGNTVMYLQQFTIQGTTSFFMVIALFYMAPLITVIAFLFLLLLALPIKYSSGRIAKAGDGLAEEWNKTNNRLIMSIKNILLLKIYGMQFEEEKLTQVSLKKYVSHLRTYYIQSGFVFGFPQIFGVLLICVISYTAKNTHQLSVGILISYFYLFVRFLQNTSQLSTAISNYIFQKPQLQALFDWWKEQFRNKQTTEWQGADLAIEQNTANKPFAWQMNNVSFGYSSSNSIVKNFNLDIPAGTTTVLLGPSGAGKTTIINLLLGQLTPDQGDIQVEINGKHESMQLIRDSVLSYIGYVGAESFLVDGTIYENIVYGLRSKPSDIEIDNALQQAECQFILELPDRFEHLINDQGQGLSAGQKQRLCLMRALLRKPLTLILDEATANLDMETERKLVTTLAKLKGAMTIIAVTHRQELLQIADQQIKI